jgi:hypothetical protein
MTDLPFFILNQRQNPAPEHMAEEGLAYRWSTRSSGAARRLAQSSGSRFIYYRPGKADDGTAHTYFGTGVIVSVDDLGEDESRVRSFRAHLGDYRRLPFPIPMRDGPRK